MPTWCGERWIGAALQSIAAEEAKGIEVLLLDSSPTSATADTARRYAECLNLRVLVRPDLQTWQAKTNHGVAIAAADHICWLHQDDLWLPGRAAAVRAWIAAAPNAALHLAPSLFIDYEGRRLGILRCPLPAGRQLPSDLVFRRLLVQNFVSAPAPVFRRQAWLDCGGMDDRLWYTGDWDIWLRLAASGPVIYHDQATSGFRIHRNSQTVTGSRNLADFEQQMRIVLDRHMWRLGAERTTERAALASVAVNTALAAVGAGHTAAAWQAIRMVTCLGPSGIYRYVRDSCIVERLGSRVRAKWRGSL
jgi:glycosyltransferase involved in cell wall biosynthesis